jgi:hypothetical protein
LAIRNPINIAVLLVAATGVRISECLGLRWRRVLWDENRISIEQVFRHGEILNRTKIKASKAPVLMCEALARTLNKLRQQTEYSRDEDFVFASPTLDGKRPLWGQTMNAKFVKPAANALGLVAERRVFWLAPFSPQSEHLGERDDQGHHGQSDDAAMPNQIPRRSTRTGTLGRRWTLSAFTWNNCCG